MKKHFPPRASFLLLLITTLLVTGACKTSAPSYNYRQLARASVRLGIDIDLHDNHQLYIKASEWIGTPYRYSANSKRGTDCSGLTQHLYKDVYRIKLDRHTQAQRDNCKKVSKRNLQEGDLVFFTSERSKKKVAHVGIYLKNNQFIHASTSKGVIISSLSEPYYTKHWLSGGRMRK